LLSILRLRGDDVIAREAARAGTRIAEAALAALEGKVDSGAVALRVEYERRRSSDPSPAAQLEAEHGHRILALRTEQQTTFALVNRVRLATMPSYRRTGNRLCGALITYARHRFRLCIALTNRCAAASRRQRMPWPWCAGDCAGTRTFIVQWTDPATAQKRREPLGKWGSITVTQARDVARSHLGDVAKGIDPRSVRLAAKARAEIERAETKLTFDALVDEWARLHLSGKRPRYRIEAQRALKHAFALQLKRPASRLSRADAVNVLDRLVSADTPAIAGRTLAYARACYGWALRRGKVPSNPFAGLPIPAGNPARDRVLSDAEVRRVWAAASAMSKPWGPMFRLLILTLVRREEAAGMMWSELSPDLQTWTIPAARMKRGHAHFVALLPPAQEALRAVTRIEGQDLVFSTTGQTHVSGFSKAKATLDEKSRVNDWRLHDLRRTGVSTLAGMGFDPIVADRLLGHQPGKLSAVARVYQRHDFAAERKAALLAWAAHVIAAPSTANVLPLLRKG
jgi:integrase